MQIDLGLSQSYFVGLMLKKLKAIEMIMAQNGRAVVMKASPNFAFVFEIFRVCYWVLKSKTV